MMKDTGATFTSQVKQRRKFDEETGLYNYRARMYDSDLGRFYGADPHGLRA